jgi:type I restriction enzyme S subunit
MHNSWIENKKICPPVPLGWEWIPLKDVTQVQGGFAFHSSDFTTFGIPVVRMSDLKQGMLDLSEAVKVSDQTVCQLSQFMLKKGDMIIGMSGSITNYAIVDEQNLPAYLNQRVGRLILKDENRANYNYLTHVLRSPFYESWAYKEATGVAQLNISSQQIEAMYFLLPPLPEQRRIAEILDTIDEAIQKTEALISKLKAMKQGLLHDLLTRGLDKNGKLRDPKVHPEQFKDSPLGRIPKEWKVEKLGEICRRSDGSVQTGPFGSQLHAKDYKDSGIPIITVEHLGDNQIIYNNLPLVGRMDYERLERYRIETGDLVFSRVGAIDRCAYVSEQENGWLFSGRCLRVRTGGKFVNPRFLSFQLNSHGSRKWILNHSVGSTMACLNTSILSEVPVLLPLIQEQENMALLLDAHDARIRTEEQYRDKLKLQKKGLMHDLLTGKVRVEM